MRFCLIAFLIAICLPAYGAVRMPAIFADHMVIQRNEPVHVWGDASSGEAVTVSFRGVERSTIADGLGRWSLQLPAGAAGGPFTLSVRGTNSITLTDVLVGDVWIASGQSNMGFALRESENATQEIAAAHLPQVRLMNVLQRYADYPQEDVTLSMPWSVCSPDSARDFSAVAYFFARDVERHEHVPIGIIESAWGGTPAEAWTSMDALARDAGLMPVFAAWAAMADGESAAARSQDKERRDVEAKYGTTDENLRLPWHPIFGSWAPAALYNGMIAPLTPFPIRGVIWYQGESNTDSLRAPVYGRLFQAMIQDWRSAWHEGNFPFLFVQIANYDAGPGDGWPIVREAQSEALSLTNTAMAVTIDIGNPQNIHPTDKQDVGFRLALAARALAYGEKVEYSGPAYRTMSRDGSTLRLFFDHADKGLVAKGGTLEGFEVAGSDGKFVPATATIDGNTVLVSSPSVAAPRQARYGWANSPVCNLFNSAGLPASPFRTAQQ